MDLILGSQSPRRKEILNFFSLPFRQRTSHFDEDSVPFTRDPASYATTLALEKAKTLIKSYPDSLIITADTVVYVEGTILGKPTNDQEMLQMLQSLSNRWHSVITAVVAMSSTTCASGAEETKVLCNNLTPDQLHRYMRVHTLHDKAGGYAIQKSGSLFIQRIEGCYYNVCGLPINTLSCVLEKHGINLWNYLKDFE